LKTARFPSIFPAPVQDIGNLLEVLEHRGLPLDKDLPGGHLEPLVGALHLGDLGVGLLQEVLV
jgi:hypothetical protein